MMRQTRLDRSLHRLALQNTAFRRFCFRRECERNDRFFDPRRDNVFIAGLARSGSTALLNELYASGAFAATTYAMMPLVLAPSIARTVARLRRRPAEPVERAHGDTIDVGIDSPEALDGIFWSTFLPAPAERLQPREVPPAALREYAMFIENLLLDAGAGRYLSKMNQGIDKLASLAAYFDRSVFLLPFRDPLQQASSLRRQHQRFGQLSGYERQYFGWLGHHEFGALHQRFCCEDAVTSPAFEPNDLNYWLAQWRDVYVYLAQLTDLYPNLHPVCYEHMTQSQSFWEVLSHRLNTQLSGAGMVDRNRADRAATDEIDATLLQDCQSLYTRLKQQGLGGANS